MKKTIFILVLAAFSLSSCLKDKPNTDFSSIGTVVELPWSGLQYLSSKDAITDAADTITKSFGINIASAKTLSTATDYTIAVDYSLMTAYNANPSNPGIVYEEMPAGSYKISKLSGTIPAGGRLDSVTVTFYKNMLDPSKSYMLPIKLASASNGTVSGNFNAHYYHFIGNDFAGTYTGIYTRWPIPDTSGTPDNNHVNKGPIIFQPVTSTEFTVTSYYYYGIPYHVTFTKTVTGGVAMYSNWQIFFTAADIQTYFVAPGAGVVLGTGPFIDPSKIVFDPNKSYTYAESLKLFRFFYTTGTRAVIDEYVKP